TPSAGMPVDERKARLTEELEPFGSRDRRPQPRELIVEGIVEPPMEHRHSIFDSIASLLRRPSVMTLARIFRADAPSASVLIRLVVGLVFASEGIQKFLYADAQGAGRFARIGIPAPEVMGPFVGVVEIVCGSLLLAGLATR